MALALSAVPYFFLQALLSLSCFFFLLLVEKGGMQTCGRLTSMSLQPSAEEQTQQGYLGRERVKSVQTQV